MTVRIGRLPVCHRFAKQVLFKVQWSETSLLQTFCEVEAVLTDYLNTSKLGQNLFVSEFIQHISKDLLEAACSRYVCIVFCFFQVQLSLIFFFLLNYFCRSGSSIFQCTSKMADTVVRVQRGEWCFLISDHRKSGFTSIYSLKLPHSEINSQD